MSRRLRLLVLAYYFPPAGGAGVQRIAKLVKYLSRSGWDITVLTPDPAVHRVCDESLTADIPDAVRVVHSLSLEPRRRLQVAAGDQGKAAARPWYRLLLDFGSGWLWLPDSMVRWVPGALWSLRRLLVGQPPDMILVTLPPFSLAWTLLLSGVMRRVPTVLDFRDLWTDNPFYRATGIRDRLCRHLEQHIINDAAGIVTVTGTLVRQVRVHQAAGARPPLLLENGFDADDCAGLKAQPASDTGPVRMGYTGSFCSDYGPHWFLAGVREYCRQSPATLQIDFIGSCEEDHFVPAELAGIPDGVVRCHGYLTHGEALRRLCDCALALVLYPPDSRFAGSLTGKIFEYIGLRLP
ncbi:MAG TPA: glycosyltransferase, partial [bacterium]|nr:glycosyltransferase [bacterium]